MVLAGVASYILSFVVIWTIWLAWKIAYIPGRKREYDALPGAPRVPILGHLGQLFRFDQTETFKVVQAYMGKYSRNGIVVAQIMNYPVVFVFHPRLAEVVLGSKKHIEKSEDYKLLHPWLGTGLLTSSGSKWHSRRRLLTPSFHFQILKDFVVIFNEQAQIFCNKLMTKADGETSFNIYPLITLCTLDIICETAMGKKMNAQSQGSSEYVWAVKRMSEIVIRRIKSVWYWNKTVFSLTPLGNEEARCLKILHGTTDKVIAERAKALRNDSGVKTTESSSSPKEDNDIYFGKRKRLAFLDTLLMAAEDGKELSFSDIREEVDTFMFEGHDTTTVAANWAIYFMGQYPEIQDKVYQEMVEIFGVQDRRAATYEDLNKMTYLECVIKETLRLHPSVPAIGRTLTNDEMFGEYLVPKGTSVAISKYRLHRSPEFFPNPEHFDPERFTLENSMKRDPYAYIPFSAGLRNCIGQKFAMLEEKVILSTIVRNFKIKSVVPREKLVLCPELILRPRDGIEVILTKRN